MLAADGQQLRVRPHESASNGDAEHEQAQAAPPPQQGRATSRAAAAASAAGEYGDDFEEELDEPGEAGAAMGAARRGDGRAAELQHEIAELRISLHALKSARAMGEAAGAELVAFYEEAGVEGGGRGLLFGLKIDHLLLAICAARATAPRRWRGAGGRS